MNYLALLLITYFVYTFVSLIISKFNVLHPCVIFCVSFNLMLFLALCFQDTLGFYLQNKTYIVLSLAGVYFVMVGGLFEFMPVLSARKAQLKTIPKRNVEVSDTIMNFLILFLFTSILIALLRLYLNTSYGSFSERMRQLKEVALYDNTAVIRLNALTSSLYKFNISVTYVIAYVFIYNVTVINKKLKEQKKYITSIILFLVFSAIAQGARQPSVELILYMIFLYIYYKYRGTKIKEILKIIFPAVVVLAVVFFLTMQIVGRRQSNRGLLEYIAVYFCGGLYAFNSHIYNPCCHALWGEASFSDIYVFLNKYGFYKNNVSSYHDFELYGNTVTIFGRWYEDFGEIGVYLMAFLVASVFIGFYKKAFSNQASHLSIMFYFKLLLALVWAGYDDRIRPLISFSTVFIFFLMYLSFELLVGRNYNFRIVKKRKIL